MIRSQFSGSFLIVEGDKDARFFRNYISSAHCRIEPAMGKDNAIGALQILEQDSFAGVLTIVDADFHLLEGKLLNNPNLIYTDHHDLEVTLVNSQALDKLLTEYGSAEKIARFESRIGKDIRTILIEAGRIIGCLRWVSLQQGLGLDFEGITFSDFTDQSSLTIDPAKLIRAVKNRSQKHSLNETETLEAVQNLMGQDHDALHICCGHDLTALLSAALRITLGSNNANDVKQEVIEKSLRLAFEASLLSTTRLYESIRGWEERNPPFKILHVSS